eukprot:CAMPEP_0177589270 /NCGR_PEP_ID=MMETSP0419_2-20121207/6706_1 /TAXON_ID=582737 /ORGANISM="Tetraselmis sp., Strain GSL018" /LENGTH=139 /DNA_ID=CAMNT_0019079597 /DNA_START=140 /DNA_END=559 /DNA_ORIENTATION=+
MSESAAHEVQKGLEDLVNDLERNTIRPAQKKNFLCSAKCCDTASNSRNDLQKCLQRCAEPVSQMEQVITWHMNQFQERLQRCVVRCQDEAQDSLPSGPSEKQIEGAQAKMDTCVKDCAKQYAAQIPKLKQDILASLKSN